MSTAAEKLKGTRHAWEGFGSPWLFGKDNAEELNADEVQIGNRLYDLDNPSEWGSAAKDFSRKNSLKMLGSAALLSEGTNALRHVMAMVSMSGNMDARQIREGVMAVENARNQVEAEYDSLRVEEQYADAVSRLKEKYEGDEDVLQMKLSALEEATADIRSINASFKETKKSGARSPYSSKHFASAVDKLVNYEKVDKSNPFGHGFVFLSDDGDVAFKSMPYESMKEAYDASASAMLKKSRESATKKDGKEYYPLTTRHFIGLLVANMLVNTHRKIHAEKAFGKDIGCHYEENHDDDDIPVWGDDDVKSVEGKKGGGSVVRATRPLEDIAEDMLDGVEPTGHMLSEAANTYRSSMPTWLGGYSAEPDMNEDPDGIASERLLELISKDDDKKVNTLFIGSHHDDGDTKKRVGSVDEEHAKMGDGDVNFKKAGADMKQRYGKFVKKTIGAELSEGVVHSDGVTTVFKSGGNAFPSTLVPENHFAWLVDKTGKVKTEYNVQGYSTKVKNAPKAKVMGADASQHAATFNVYKLTPKEGGPSRTLVVESHLPARNGKAFDTTRCVEPLQTVRVPTKNGDKIGAAVSVDMVKGKKRSSITAIRLE